MNSLQTRDAVMLGDRRWQLHRLDRLHVDHLPFTLKVLLENLLRHEDGRLVTAGQVDYYRHGGVLPYVLRTVTRAPGRRDGPGRPGPPPG